MNLFLKTILATALLSSMTLNSHVYAAERKNTAQQDNVIEVASEIRSLKEDLAYTQIFSEICPQLIGQNKNFDKAYKHTIEDKLKDVPNPDVALKYLNQDDEEYQALLQKFRQDISQASSENNRGVCLDMIEWDKTKKK